MPVMKHESEWIHPGFEIQTRRHQNSNTGVSVPHLPPMTNVFQFKKKVNFGGSASVVTIQQ